MDIDDLTDLLIILNELDEWSRRGTKPETLLKLLNAPGTDEHVLIAYATNYPGLIQWLDKP